MSSSVRPSASSPAPGLQKQPVRSEMSLAVRQFLDAPIVDQMALRVVAVQRDRPASHRRRRRPVDADHVASVAVSQIEQRAEQPFGEARHARVNGLDADALEMSAGRSRRRGCSGNSSVPSSNPASPGDRMWTRPCTVAKFTVPPANHGRCRREQRRRSRRAGSRRRSDSRTSCRTRSATKSGFTRLRSSRLVGTNAAASSRTSQPLACAASIEIERMPDAGEVRLSREGEQVRARPDRRGRAASPSAIDDRCADRERSAARSRRSRPWRRANSRMPFTEL